MKTYIRHIIRGMGSLMVAISWFVIGIPSVLAAEISFSAPSEVVSVGEEVVVTVLLDPQGASVNALEATITYSADVARLWSLRSRDSIVDAWLSLPDPQQIEDEGSVTISGIIVGGFDGVRRAFEHDLGTGVLVDLHLFPQQIGELTIDAHTIQLFANDGEGTPVEVVARPLRLSVVPLTAKNTGALNDAHQGDTTPPAPFTPLVSRNEGLFDNQWFVVFSTQDTGSGIDYYEIAEERGVPSTPERYDTLDWSRAESPMVLSDQRRRSTIYIKAIDNAGNRRIEVVEAEVVPWYDVIVDNLFLFLGIIGAWFVVLVFLRRGKK